MEKAAGARTQPECMTTATGHEHHVRSGTCGRGEHVRCRHRSQYDAKCVYICTCSCHTANVLLTTAVPGNVDG